MDAELLRKADRHLAASDPVMARLIKRNGPCRMSISTSSLFHSLAMAIIAQQLSTRAADTIQARVMRLVSRPLTPKRFAAASPDALRQAGLSKQKAGYIRNLAEAVEAGLSKAKLKRMDDREAIGVLTAVKGVGRWTAEMYLIFGLGRPDVLSLGDAGLQRAAREFYNDGTPEEGLLARVGENWRPCRSVASWHLWTGLG